MTTDKPTTTASARPENMRGEYKGKRWDKTREKAQEVANKTGATFYAFPEHDGSIAIEIDYPKSGVYFETFKPVKRTIPAEKPTEATYKVRLRNGLALTESMELERQRDELHRLWDASASEARRNKAQAAQLAEACKAMLSQCRDSNEPTAISLRLQLSQALAAYEEGK